VTSFGSGAMTNSIAELEDASVIFIIGSNTTETHPIIASYIKRGVKKGAKLIVADPRKTDIAKLADIHLQQRVGTDIPLINAMMNVILKNDLHNKEFIAEHTEGFEDMVANLEKYTPEYAESISGVPKALIEMAAGTYARGENSSICYTMGITQHICGVDNVMSLANLVMLCGQIGRPSTGLNPLRGQNNVQGACDMGALPNVYTAYQNVTLPEVKEKFENAWKAELSDKPGLTMTTAFDKFGEDIKGFICFGENPAMSEPDLPHAKSAMEKLDFMVVMDLFKTESTDFAHVVLPCATNPELDGTFTNTERKVMRIRKAVNPPGESKPGWWILNEIAKRMDYDLNCQNAGQIWDEEISVISPSLAGIKYELLKNRGYQWPKPGLDHPGTPYLHKDGNFARGKGAFKVIDHTEPAEMPDDEFPLWMTTGRRLQHFHTAAMTRKARGLSDLLPEEPIEINPVDAKKLKIKDGAQIIVKSRRGEIKSKAWVTDRVPPGTIFVSFHFYEANANELTNTALDPVCKIPEYKACAVHVEPA
jgi:predicted molibdopterin-dependent oxidoreductase YjgC